MRSLELLGQARTADGSDLTLTRHGTEYVILANGKSLMSSRMHGSEEALATFACKSLRTREEPRVLVVAWGWDSPCARRWTFFLESRWSLWRNCWLPLWSGTVAPLDRWQGIR